MISQGEEVRRPVNLNDVIASVLRFVRSDALDTGMERATYGQAFGRTLMIGFFFSIFFMGGALDFVWPLWDRKRQAWHDKVAGTVVIRTEHRRAA